MSELPADEVMRQMARIALETATESIAGMAEDYAKKILHGEFGPDVTPHGALLALAAAIRSTNAKTFPRPDHSA